MVQFYKRPFAETGDKAAIPTDTQSGGSLDYQRDLATDPAAKAIPRDQTNQFYYDLTLNIQQYQIHGVPEFITSADNGGSPYSYNKFAMVRYDDGNGYRNYMSLSDTNTFDPSDKSAWGMLDATNAILGVGFDAGVVDGDVVYYDTGVPTFKKAQANGTVAGNVIGIADVTYGSVILSGVCNLFSGLTPGSIYYLSASSAGQVSTVLPGLNRVRMGIAKSATELFVQPQVILNPNFIGMGMYNEGSAQTIPGDHTNNLIIFKTLDFDHSKGVVSFDSTTNYSYKALVAGVFEVTGIITLRFGGASSTGSCYLELWLKPAGGPSFVNFQRLSQIDNGNGDDVT